MNKHEVIAELQRCKTAYHTLENNTPTASLAVPLKDVTYTKQDLANVLDLQPYDVQNIMDSFEDEFFVKDGRNWAMISREQANRIIHAAGIKTIPELREEKPELYEVPVLIVNKSKGGVGKTTSALHLAVESALDVLKNQQVLLIDADPQGSIVHHIGATDMDTVFASVAQLIMDNAEMPREERLSPENQAKFREYLLENVLIDSYLDNLKILPSVMTDTQINYAITKKIANDKETYDAIRLYNDIIIEPMKELFDMIIVDTSPSPDLTVTSLYYAANHVLFVTTGRKQDYRSFISHHENLSIMLEQIFPDDFKGYHSIKTLITKHIREAVNNPTSVMMAKNVSKMRSVSDTYTQMIHESTKYELSSEKKLPLQLLDTVNDKAYRSAIDELKNLYYEFSATMNKFLWKE